MNGNPSDIYDLCIIGGGINGAGIARDAAGRGLKVLLLEKDDLASATSSASSKLIHGGLRYLEHYELRLVRESLKEREVLLKMAPHIIWPLNFILPHASHIRPFWLIRMGLYLYDVLSFSFGNERRFHTSEAIKLSGHTYGAPLQDKYFRGVSYSDGWVQDSRLVVLNAMSAQAKGAKIHTRCECVDLKMADGRWHVSVHDKKNNKLYEISAKVIVNAAGPWVRSFLDKCNLVSVNTPSMRLVQGSHIIVPRLYEGDQAYILQQVDKRIVFAIPYEGQYTLIGTTDTNIDHQNIAPAITEDEIAYLLNAANSYFQKQISKSEIVSSYSGVRGLLDDRSANAREITRDYKLHLEQFNGLPILSVFGGKITTYRKLAEGAMGILASVLPVKGKATSSEALPGGDIPNADFKSFLRQQKIRWEKEDISLIERYARNYGTKMNNILSQPKGVHYGDQVYETEIRYLIEKEFALTLEDILWRRSKLGLHVSEETRNNLAIVVPELVKEITGYEFKDASGN